MKKIIIFLLILVILLNSISIYALGCNGGSCVPYMNQSKLIRWYPLNDTGGNATDHIGVDPYTDLICSNIAGYNVADAYGGSSAMDFERDSSSACKGDDYYQSLGVSAGATLTGWFKFETDVITAEQWFLGLWNTFNSPEYTISGESGVNGIRGIVKYSAGYVSLRTNISDTGQWHHFALTRDIGSTYNIYTDGTLNATFTAGSITDYGELQLIIGSTNTNTLFFDGIASDVTVWNRTLSAEEVLFMYEGSEEEEEAILINITSPLNNTNVTQDPLDINFTTNFNFTKCELYNNVSGVYSLIDTLENITQVSSYPENLNAFYRFEEGTGTNATDLSGNDNHGLIVNGEYSASRGINNTGDYSINLSSTTDYVNITDNDYLDINESLSISAWIWVNKTISSKFLSKYDAGASQRSYSFGITSLGYFIGIVSKDGTYSLGTTGFQLQCTNPITEKSWQHVVFTADAVTHTLNIYHNGVLNATLYDADFDNIYKSTAHLYLGVVDTMTQNFQGLLDEVAIYNKTLNSTEIMNIYNNGITVLQEESSDFTAGNYTFTHDLPINTIEDIGYYVECTLANTTVINSSLVSIHYDNDITPPNITLVYPVNNSKINTNVVINFTTNEPATCSLNDTLWTESYSNTTFFSYAETIAGDGIYNINISCYDVVGNEGYLIIYLEKDTVFPLQTWNNPSISNDSTLYFNQSNNIIANFFDENLFAYEIGVYDELDNLQYNFSDTNLAVDSFNFSESIIPLSLGTWKIISTVADSHTKQDIGIYDYSIEAKKIKYKFTKIDKLKHKEIIGNVTIEYNGKYDVKSINTTKEQDRYTFEFEFNMPKGIIEAEHRYNVHCDDIYIVKNTDSRYMGHIVCNTIKKWIDFNADNVISTDIVECGNDCLTVIQKTYPDDKIKYKSIGGLNEQTETILFGVEVEPIPTFLTDFLEFDNCPTDSLADAFIFAFLFFILIVMWIFARYWVRVPIVTIAIGFGVIVYALSLIKCNQIIGMLMLIMGFGVILEAFFNQD